MLRLNELDVPIEAGVARPGVRGKLDLLEGVHDAVAHGLAGIGGGNAHLLDVPVAAEHDARRRLAPGPGGLSVVVGGRTAVLLDLTARALQLGLHRVVVVAAAARRGGPGVRATRATRATSAAPACARGVVV